LRKRKTQNGEYAGSARREEMVFGQKTGKKNGCTSFLRNLGKTMAEGGDGCHSPILLLDWLRSKRK